MTRTYSNTDPKDPQAELRKTIEKKVRYVAYHGTTLTTWGMVNKATDDLLAIFQAHQQQLLTELLGHENAITILGTDGKPELIRFVPFSVINRKIGELNG